jgi:hypothetical protein
MKMFVPDLVSGKLETLKEGVERIAGEGTNKEKYVIAVDIQQSSLTILYSSAPNHALPLAINVASNTELLLRRLSASTPTSHISNTNDPFEKQYGILDHLKFGDIFITGLEVGIAFITLFALGLGLLAAGYIVGPVEERICQVRFSESDLGGISFMIF